MSILTCRKCKTEWSATVYPFCPVCLLSAWLASPSLIGDKHDPGRSSEIHDQYRSIVTADLVNDPRAYLEAAVREGTWYYNIEYATFNHVTRLPLRRKPGVGVGAGNVNPDRHLDDLVIADADREPHVFADDSAATREKVRSGVYQPLGTCNCENCDNLVVPRYRECAVHVKPPLAFSPPAEVRPKRSPTLTRSVRSERRRRPV